MAIKHLVESDGALTGSIEANLRRVVQTVTSLGVNIKVVDSAVKEVEASNKILVDNMQQVCDVMEVMTGRISKAEFTTKEMLSKYEESAYKLIVQSNPRVFNRRKYPRMPLANSCEIMVMGTDKSYSGRMVNISANGFAFACRDNLFENSKGKDVIVDVKNFDVLKGKALEGCIIRSSNNDGEYIVGCRMPEDSDAIKAYVSKNYSE